PAGVRTQPAAREDRDPLALLAKGPGRRSREVFVTDALVVVEVLRYLRSPVRGEVGGRRTEHEAADPEAAHGERRVAFPRNTDHRVPALVHDVDEPVGELQLQPQLGVCGGEAGD